MADIVTLTPFEWYMLIRSPDWRNPDTEREDSEPAHVPVMAEPAKTDEDSGQ